MKKILLGLSLGLGLVLSPATLKPEPKNCNEVAQNIALITLAGGTALAAYNDYVTCFLKTLYGIALPESITAKNVLLTLKDGASAIGLFLLTNAILNKLH